jgi:hypothetical protein
MGSSKEEGNNIHMSSPLGKEILWSSPKKKYFDMIVMQK